MNQRMRRGPKNRRGFTLVEIMIVVAIICLLSALAVPSWLRARKRAQAVDIYNQLRVLDNGVTQYAIDTNKAPGTQVFFTDLQNYIKAGTPLYLGGGNDLVGNPVGPFFVDATVQVSSATFNGMSDVAPASFWSPY